MAVAIQPSVIVHGGMASKLVVTAPSSVSADAGAAPGLITVEIQDDTGGAAVLTGNLEVTLSSTNATGTFTDADGEAIVDNTVTIAAGSTEATAYYSDTGAGTTAMVIAQADGLSSGTASITVITEIDMITSATSSIADSGGGCEDCRAGTAIQ